MSLSTFFQQIKTQIKSAISTHPIEIFMIATFALGIWFVDMNSEKDHLAYWLFEPDAVCLYLFHLALMSGIVFRGLCRLLPFFTIGK